MKNLMLLGLIAAMSVQGFADDEPKRKKGKNAGGRPGIAANVAKALAAIELTDDQQSKFEAVSAAYTTSMKALREKGLTQELTKKKTEAMKAAREEGLKGKEIAAKVNGSMTEAEVALLASAQEAQTTLKKAVAGMLTPEQMAALPEAAQKMITVRGGNNAKGKGNRKKKDAA